MNKKVQATGFGKKSYAQPEMKVYQVKPASIICTSGKTESLQEEDYSWDGGSVKEQRNYSNSVTW